MLSQIEIPGKIAYVEAAPRHADQAARHERKPLAGLFAGYGLCGGLALALLALVEWADVQATTPFDSFFDRLAFSAYFGLNILTGITVGLLVASAVFIASASKNLAARILKKWSIPAAIAAVSSHLIVASLAAVLLKQQAHVHGFVLGLVREAEKMPNLRSPLLRHEVAASYLLTFSLLVGVCIIWAITRSAASMSRLLRWAWLAILVAALAAAYYTDSRVEVQLYEYSMHRAMYLLEITLAMALIGTVYLSHPAISSTWSRMKPSLRRGLAAAAIVMLAASITFTFIHFDRNQSLKTKVFYLTTQAKQSFKAARWLLDYDRDGYSALLGGGDSNDFSGLINPGEKELIADGLDNNSIGGDLSHRSLDEWLVEHKPTVLSAALRPKHLNIIFIFIDTLRPDHMSLYGYARKTTPNIDKLAARSSVFENAYAPAPDTYGSLPRFMQSSYWDGHFMSWTEVLAKNGYDGLFFPRRPGLVLRHMKGMRMVEQARVDTFHETIDVALDVLGSAAQDRPFCAYLYSFDPHLPYVRHRQLDFGASMEDRYDSEIAYTDYHLGRLFDWIEKSGRLDDTMIVIMSDHGESLGERRVYRHATQLYDEQVRVPLLIYLPGLPARRISDYVSTVDLGSTILDAIGLEIPAGYQGTSLLPLMRGEPFAHPPVYGEQVTKEASPYVPFKDNIHPERRKNMVITQDGYKLIYNREAYSFELYDLKRDRKETTNLYDRMPEKAAEMKRLLGRFVDVVTYSRPWDADDSKHSYGREIKQRESRESRESGESF
ncbi:MAG TPA: sulfatase [Blastocatellia bacterium]|nr:sulfatase [Blastocatellia bacterium]